MNLDLGLCEEEAKGLILKGVIDVANFVHDEISMQLNAITDLSSENIEKEGAVMGLLAHKITVLQIWRKNNPGHELTMLIDKCLFEMRSLYLRLYFLVNTVAKTYPTTADGIRSAAKKVVADQEGFTIVLYGFEEMKVEMPKE